MGSLWGLLGYLILWPVWWLVLKSPEQGAQTFLYATMDADMGRGVGVRLLKECKEMDFLRKEVRDEEVAKKLWGFSEKQIEALEKEGAVKRALAKKVTEESKNSTMEKKKNEDNEGKTPTRNEKAGKVTGSRRSRKAG